MAAVLPGEAGVAGLLVRDLPDGALARLEYYAAARGYGLRDMAVRLADGQTCSALVHLPVAGRAAAEGGGWDFAAWRARWADTVTCTAEDVMSHFPQSPPEMLRRRMTQLLVRGGARARASLLRPDTAHVRHLPGPGDVRVARLTHPYANYFAVEERDLSFRRFDGGMSPVVNRAVFISGDASVLLPYDPLRDRVMVIEQFRSGAQARGDANPWLIEAVAGRVDGGETPAEAALREAREEAGLTIRTLLEGPSYYPSPAAKGEYIYSFVGLTDLPDNAAGLGGLLAEDEDIRSHVIPFSQLMDMVRTGEADAAPLIIIAYWLERERPRLMAEARADRGGGA